MKHVGWDRRQGDTRYGPFMRLCSNLLILYTKLKEKASFLNKKPERKNRRKASDGFCMSRSVSRVLS